MCYVVSVLQQQLKFYLQEKPKTQCEGWRLQAAAVGCTFIILSEAVTPQQVDAISRTHVEVDVLQVQQDGEEQRPLQVLGLYNTKTDNLSLFLGHSFIQSTRRFQVCTLRCFATDSSRKPNKKPLYWKWISEQNSEGGHEESEPHDNWGLEFRSI